MASAIICLATNQIFNFSKYIFESMVKHLDSANKFLLYPRFVQVFLDKQLDGMSKYNAIYVIPSHIKKVFSNMRRTGKDFSRRDIPLFPTMLVQPQAGMGEGSTMPSAPQHTPIIQPTTSKPQKKQKPKKPRRQDTQETQPSDPTTNVEDEALNEENVSTVIDLENTKTVQAKKISSLKRRVKKLERKKRSETHRLKRLYKVGLSTRVESSAEEQSLGKEEASKQERNIADIDADAETTLVNETTEDQGRYNDEEMFDIDVLNDEETSKLKERGIIMQEPSESPTTTIPISSKVQDKGKDYELAARLQEEEQGELTIKENSRLFVELMDKIKKHFAKLRVEEQRRKPPTKAQKRNQMCVYLKNMAEFTHNQLKNKSFDEVQKAFDKTISWINLFVHMDSKVVKDKAVLTQESSLKRAVDELDQGRSKKQKVEDDKEQEELKRCLEIIPDDGDDVTIDATPLSIKTLIMITRSTKKGKELLLNF
uniref:Uncharacterized protein n=1 Tax=Tanacetum cinerariifolium TaxID=118510 RepID=A0A6L2M445_TANCI|nr:hypothetical protein [Tanacetum cinerariifolium]